MLLECAAHSTHRLKADYSTVELQKHGGDGATRTHISLQITGVQDRTDTNFWLRLHLWYSQPELNWYFHFERVANEQLFDESMVEQKGLEPPTPEAPDLQSGTLPITLYCSIRF